MRVILHAGCERLRIARDPRRSAIHIHTYTHVIPTCTTCHLHTKYSEHHATTQAHGMENHYTGPWDSVRERRVASITLLLVNGMETGRRSEWDGVRQANLGRGNDLPPRRRAHKTRTAAHETITQTPTAAHETLTRCKWTPHETPTNKTPTAAHKTLTRAHTDAQKRCWPT